MIAPTWLTSLGVDPEVDWAGASPPAFAYLHLTNMWHCFPHMCWSKAVRGHYASYGPALAQTSPAVSRA